MLDMINEDLDGASYDLGYDGEDLLDRAEEAIQHSAFLMDVASPSELEDVCESLEDINDLSDIMGFPMEASIVRLDRASRLKHLRKANVLSLARKNNDSRFNKLLTIWKMERDLEKGLEQIYGSRALQMANQQIRNYATNGVKKIPKAYPDTKVGKGKPSSQIAKRAVAQGKKFFNQKKTMVPQRFSWN